MPFHGVLSCLSRTIAAYYIMVNREPRHFASMWLQGTRNGLPDGSVMLSFWLRDHRRRAEKELLSARRLLNQLGSGAEHIRFSVILLSRDEPPATVPLWEPLLHVAASDLCPRQETLVAVAAARARAVGQHR